MYPYIFNVIPTFGLLVVIGIIGALVAFRLLSKRFIPNTEVYNYYATSSVFSIAAGLLFALLFQSFYNWIDSGFKNFQLSGVTFMGGLIGGAVTFVLFAVFAKPHIKREFWTVACVAAPCIAIGHAFGRFGCFFAGCCYGIKTDSIFGVTFPGHSSPVLPTQLFEAIFLLALFAVLLFTLLKTKHVDMPIIIYGIGYAVFRFIIEFFRGDERGTFIPGLQPSQWQSILLLIVAIGLFVLVKVFKKVPFKNTPDKIEKTDEPSLADQTLIADQPPLSDQALIADQSPLSNKPPLSNKTDVSDKNTDK